MSTSRPLRINIVGGGPAGLYFAILMKLHEPRHQIQVYERNPRGATWGWGVVFSDQTLAYLAEPDPESFARLAPLLKTWDNVDIVHRGQRVTIHGNRFSALSRIGLLEVLTARAEELGIGVSFASPVADAGALDRLPECDLLVGADGRASVVRDHYRTAFAPDLQLANNRFIWLGTPHLFHGLTLTFRPTGEGLFIAHSYEYSDDLSTFVVECDPDTFASSGLGERDEVATRAFLEAVFAEDLAGAPLLSNASSWIRFTTVRNGHWHHFDRQRKHHVVLLGDALHTAHFSIGSGTKLALEDAILLAGAFATDPEPTAALVGFEMARRPRVEQLQAAASTSMAWFEHAADDLHLTPLAFAYKVMTRSSRLDRNRLLRRDPEFVAAVERESLNA
jgi:2-polyprenyl-6-methoxyphenol hydroxylase-like FAD-dependent oxidoreductase